MQVKALEGERQAAIQAAARAEAEVQELEDSKRRLEWQSQLLGRMSEVQTKHSQAKSEAIRDLLSSDTGMHGLDASAYDGGDPESPTLSAQLQELQRKYLG